MIGHYVNNLSVAQEDRVLTMVLRPGRSEHPDGARCLLGAVIDRTTRLPYSPRIEWGTNVRTYMSPAYDALCYRFGAPRVNIAIRNRILSNRLWRMLENRPASQETAVGECRFGRGE